MNNIHIVSTITSKNAIRCAVDWHFKQADMIRDLPFDIVAKDSERETALRFDNHVAIEWTDEYADAIFSILNKYVPTTSFLDTGVFPPSGYGNHGLKVVHTVKHLDFRALTNGIWTALSLCSGPHKPDIDTLDDLLQDAIAAHIDLYTKEI